jgi:glycosyltransferase involved in cell wall biosynthesis
VSEGETPLVSIIIPCYKQARFLSESIESARAQTHRRFEIVVVDDGSPDNTAEIAAHCPNVVYLRQENSGIAAARNAGFRASRGDYLMFLDADDRLTPNAAEAHLQCFRENPAAGFVVGDIDQISSDGSYVYSPRWPILETNFYEELLRVNHVANTIAVMFNRDVLEKVEGFEKDCSPAEDYKILLRAARHFPSAHHRTVVACYRRHEANTSRKGVLMLRAMHHVMSSERRWTKGTRHLEAARKRGDVYWREHFGAVTIKEIYGHLCRGNLGQVAKASVALIWYVRERLLFLPWKHRRRVLRAVWRRLGWGRRILLSRVIRG